MKRISKTPKIFTSSYRPQLNGVKEGSRYWRIVAAVAAVIVGFLLIGRLPVFLLNDIEIEGQTTAEIATILKSLRGKSVFSSTVSRIQDQIKKEYLVVRTVKCYRGLPNSLRCKIQLREPRIVWQDNQGKALVDETGYLYERVENNIDESIITVVDMSPQIASVGSFVISPEVINHYYSLADFLKSSGISIEKVEIADTIYHFDATLRLNDGKTFSVRLTTTIPSELQAKSLLALLSKRPETISSQVDLRVPGYIYVR